MYFDSSILKKRNHEITMWDFFLSFTVPFFLSGKNSFQYSTPNISLTLFNYVTLFEQNAFFLPFWSVRGHGYSE